MAPARFVYAKRISSEEAREGYILALDNFPPAGTSFTLVRGRLTRKVKVEFYPCTCRGVNPPHAHYFIRWDRLN